MPPQGGSLLRAIVARLPRWLVEKNALIIRWDCQRFRHVAYRRRSIRRSIRRWPTGRARRRRRRVPRGRAPVPGAGRTRKDRRGQVDEHHRHRLLVTADATGSLGVGGAGVGGQQRGDVQVAGGPCLTRQPHIVTGADPRHSRGLDLVGRRQVLDARTHPHPAGGAAGMRWVVRRKSARRASTPCPMKEPYRATVPTGFCQTRALIRR